MTAVFSVVLEMALSAGILVLVVLLARWLLRGAPKTVVLLLWALVAMRLLCPFSVKSVLSLMPSTETMSTAVTAAASVPLAPPVNSAPPVSALTVATVVWLIGAAVIVVYMIVQYVRMRIRVREAALRDCRVYVCDRIDAAFILGVLRPRIYLPSDVKKRDRKYVLAHEKAHLRRGDPWWKLLGFVLLAVYWFQPLLWVAYFLFCRDLEFACDERVLRENGMKIKKAYARALINCSEPRKMRAFCPLAFGEVGVKTRIKAVLHYKKPTVWIVAVSLTVCAVAAVCFLTDPLDSRAEEPTQPVQTTATTTASATTATTVAPTTTVTTTTATAATATTTTVYVPPVTEAVYIPPTTSTAPTFPTFIVGDIPDMEPIEYTVPFTYSNPTSGIKHAAPPTLPVIVWDP